MSRKTRELAIEAEERWPALFQFLAGYCHEDWPIFYGTIEGAIDAAILDHSLDLRQRILKDWRDWNGSKGAAFDPRAAINDGLGVNYRFDDPATARQFMNDIYDKLILSVRNETGKHWKP